MPHATLVALLAAILIAAVAAASALAVPSAAAARRDTTKTRLLSCTGHGLTRAADVVVLACVDANLVIDANWRPGWTRRVARGITELQINLCKPSCVRSRMQTFRHTTVVLSGVAPTPAGEVFTRAHLTYTDAGRRHTVTAYPRT
jgi:hypothetical protein